MTYNPDPTSNKNQVDPRDAYHRYADLIAELLVHISGPTTFAIEADFTQEKQAGVHVLQVERGCIFPRLLLDASAASTRLQSIDRLIQVTFSNGTATDLNQLTIVDRTGQTRSIYRPMLVYNWLCAFRDAYEQLPREEFGRWENALLYWAESLALRLGEFDWPKHVIDASHGEHVAEACWSALALHVAGKVFIRDGFTDLAGDVFGKLLACQTPTGPFLTATASDNLETTTYYELAILHAAASYAVQCESRGMAKAVMKATQFHLNETQPDHATNQPFGLFGFIWNAQTHLMADSMLHALSVNHGSDNIADTSGITAMLLADTLQCLRLFKS